MSDIQLIWCQQGTWFIYSQTPCSLYKDRRVLHEELAIGGISQFSESFIDPTTLRSLWFFYWGLADLPPQVPLWRTEISTGVNAKGKILMNGNRSHVSSRCTRVETALNCFKCKNEFTRYLRASAGADSPSVSMSHSQIRFSNFFCAHLSAWTHSLPDF